MAIEFKLPDLGENIESGDVVSVLVNEGDTVAKDQGVVELETDKAVVEVPCSRAGVVSKIHVKKGDTIPVGALILTLDEAGGDGSSKSTSEPKASASSTASPGAKPSQPENNAPQKTKPSAAAKPSEAPEESSEDDAPAAEAAAPRSKPREAAGAKVETTERTADAAPAGPATRRLARELGVDVQSISGTGADGRITRDDVIAAVRRSTMRKQPAASAASGATSKSTPAPEGTPDQDAWGPVRRQSLTKIRKTIAANMHRSASTIPHVTNFDEADITELERIRKGGMADYVDSEVKLTSMAFVMKAVSLALRRHAVINASLDMEDEAIVYKDYVNLGVAVDTERGLMVPVIRNVDRLSIPQIAQALSDVAARARGNKIGLDEMRGGTFTISNLGAVGGRYSTPIINHPEAAILLLGRSKKTPVVVEDKVEIRLLMPLSISYDHRLVDGAAAGRFLNEVIDYLQTPGRLLLAP